MSPADAWHTFMLGWRHGATGRDEQHRQPLAALQRAYDAGRDAGEKARQTVAHEAAKRFGHTKAG